MIYYITYSEFDNMGDLAINYATIKFLYDLKINFELINQSNYKNIVINSNDILLITGGGYIGVYNTPLVNWFYNFILKYHKTNKIILLPNSFVPIKDSYKKIQNCNLTIFVRDNISLKNYQKYFINSKCYFCDDMVFYLERLPKKICKEYETEKIGKYDRKDCESCNNLIKKAPGKIELRHMSKMIPISKNCEHLETVIFKFLFKMIKYESIITDTLHMSIFSYLLHKPCIFLDNKTNKLSNTWIKYNQNLILAYDKNKKFNFQKYNFKDTDLTFNFDVLIQELLNCVPKSDP